MHQRRLPTKKFKSFTVQTIMGGLVIGFCKKKINTLKREKYVIK
jgi:preprotein translocase subunit Sec63